jgi:hypothetical protein
MMTFPIYGKIKNVPNHQPAYLLFTISKKQNTTLGISIAPEDDSVPPNSAAKLLTVPLRRSLGAVKLSWEVFHFFSGKNADFSSKNGGIAGGIWWHLCCFKVVLMGFHGGLMDVVGYMANVTVGSD